MAIRHERPSARRAVSLGSPNLTVSWVYLELFAFVALMRFVSLATALNAAALQLASI